MSARPPTRWLLPFVLFAVVPAACSNTSKSEDAAAATTAPPAAAGTSAPPESVAATTGGPPSSEQVGSGDFVLADPHAGLDALSGYTATLTTTFDGTNGGQPTKWSTTATLIRVASPQAAQLRIEHSGDGSAEGPAYIAEIAGTTFQVDDAGACTGAATDPDGSVIDALDPVGRLAGVVGGTSIGEKTVGDTAATGYSFDESAVGEAGLARTTGEVWVATDGGYVVAYTMTTAADSGFFGDGIAGTMSLTYELSDVNSAQGVELPAECGPELVDAPLTADASNVSRVGATVAFDTASSTGDVIAFYQQRAGDAGWQPVSDPVSGDRGAIVQFVAGDQTITVVAQPVASGAHVTLKSSPTSDEGSGGGQAPSGGASSGQATVTMTGGHQLDVTWQFVPEFSMLAGGTLTFDDPANPLPAGPFLTLVLGGNANISLSDGAVTIMAGTDVCSFAVDRQDATGAAGTVTCSGVQAIGAGAVDVSIAFDVGV